MTMGEVKPHRNEFYPLSHLTSKRIERVGKDRRDNGDFWPFVRER